MLNPAWLIQKKRDGEELSREELHGFIQGSLTGEITDYQVTAMLMATFFKGMTAEETVFLTEAMLESGERYDLSSIPGRKVDKHSTGGVGDKVSLILAPLAAACGLKVPMMAGRGLGHTGGTLDKLQSIPGFRVDLTVQEFKEILTDVGCAIIGQSDRIAPADKKFYSLRDVTATVDCIPLIVASILSKKLAEGTESLVLDIKVGNGAFMKTREQARRLARALVSVAKKMGLNCRAVLTDMSQPLGYASGNAIEVRECIEILRNAKSADTSSADLKEITLSLCAEMLEISGAVGNIAQGRKLAQQKLQDGSAWKKFLEFVTAQGGDPAFVKNPERLVLAPQVVTLKAKKRGYVTQMNTEAIGRLLLSLGGGRKRASDTIDPSVGFVFHRKLGTRVSSGELLATLYLSKNADAQAVETELLNAILISPSRKPVAKLILERI